MNLDVFPSRNSLADVHKHLLIPATTACMSMEMAGFRIDTKKLGELDTKYTNKLTELVDRIRSYPEIKRVEKRIGKTFNVNSPDMVRDAIFNEFGLTADDLDLTDKGQITGNSKLISTGKKNMAKLDGTHEIIDLLKEQRKYATLYKMFVKPIRPKYLCPDGKVHVSYKIHGTVTGRLSVSLLHQIPKNLDSDELGFEFDSELNIKHLFVPENKEYELLQADYSQMELRILAEYSWDEMMLGIFNRGEDIHISTGANMASIVYRNPIVYKDDGIYVFNPSANHLEKIDKKSRWRKAAKAINFGIIYGKGDESLAADLGCSVDEAKEFKRHYFAAFPSVKEWLEYVIKFVKEYKYVSTMFGNLRRLPSACSPNTGVRNEALRQAVNMGVQGTAGYYTLIALMNITDILVKYKMRTRVIATVHDSIILDVFQKERDTIREILTVVMGNPLNELIYWDRKVPFVADLETSSGSWAEVK